jgi:Domain of unknown function (DUF4249)
MRGLDFFRIKLKWLFVFVAMSSCVDRFEFDAPEPGLLTVIDGMITDRPGPYTVKISQGLRLDADSSTHAPVLGALVTLHDDEGNEEPFMEATGGTYVTHGQMQGQIGHSYHITVVMPDGSVLESQPDMMHPVGEIQAIRYEYESKKVEMPWGFTDANVFNVYVDSEAGPSDEVYVRWQYTGTYKVVTYPEEHQTQVPPYTPYKDPPPCSGYRVANGPIGSGGLLEKFGDCTCCTCWVSNYEPMPQLSDTQFIQGNKFSNIKVGEVAITPAAFFDKYLIEVDQLSLSRTAFQFFKLLRNQKENASSLFQPPSGQLIGNITSENSATPVVGIFWAAAKRTKTLFLFKTDIPYPITPNEIILDACYDIYPNATNKMHPLWH